MINLRPTFITKFLLFCFLIVAVFFANFQPALAHRPHDVVTEIEISPDYVEDKTLYIIVRSNLFKSVDQGEYWQRLYYGIDTPHELSSLAISPENKNTIFLSSSGGGIYQSQDGGQSWQRKNNNLDNLNIRDIKISPHNGDLLFALGQEQDLYKSDDSGESWTKVISQDTPITSLTFHPQSESVVVLGDENGNLLLSEDEGNQWSIIDNFDDRINALNLSEDDAILVATSQNGVFQGNLNDLSFEAVNTGLSDLEIEDIITTQNDNSDNVIVFASTRNQGIFERKNDGTWQEISEGLSKDTQADQLNLPHFSKIALPESFSQEPTMFLAGFDGLFRSQNGGQQWQHLETLAKGTITSLAISPNYENDSTLAVGMYVGNPYISNDSGASWKAGVTGLEVPRFLGVAYYDKVDTNYQDPRRFFDIGFSPNYGEDNIIIATTLWTKLGKSQNQGESWEVVSLPQEVRGLNVVFSPDFANDNIVYMGNQSGVIFKSNNGGNRFSRVGKIEGAFGNDAPSMVISANFASDQTLFATSKEGIYKTTDGGRNWRLTNNSLFADLYNFQLVISPDYQTDQKVFLGSSDGLFVTDNGGESWSRLANIDNIDNVHVDAIAISPNYANDKTLLISVMGKGLFKSVDGGETFISTGDNSLTFAKVNNIPSSGNPILFSPNYAVDQTIYGFGSATSEVFKSTDGANTWEVMTIPYSENLEYGWLTAISIKLSLNRGNIARLVAAVIVGLLTYIFVGFLRLDKTLPFSRIQIKMASSIILFLIASFVLYNI